MDRWRGRVALVTGASVGIGASIAKELVRHGMKVAGCARDVEKVKVCDALDPVTKLPPLHRFWLFLLFL